MRKSTSYAEMIGKRKSTQSQISNNSISSSKFSISSSSLLHSLTRQAKGYSFGSSPRNSLLLINSTSPSAKYNIKGIVEINLSKKMGPSMGSGRQNSVEKTPLSYISNNSNPGPASYNPPESFFKSNSSIKIGTSKNQALTVQFLNNKAINSNPGPGSYHPKVIKLKGGKIATQSKRFDTVDKQNRPGPSSYHSINLDAVSKGCSQVNYKTALNDRYKN